MGWQVQQTFPICIREYDDAFNKFFFVEEDKIYAFGPNRDRKSKLQTEESKALELVTDYPVKSWYPSFEAYCDEHRGFVKASDGRWGYTCNPNAKWDWWQIGGRFPNRFLVPAGLQDCIPSAKDDDGESATRTETVLNKAYQEMAEHYGTAIIPTRPRTPKDKAFVEGSVGVVSTWILAALRNRQFLSLDELNRAIWEKLADFNHKPFQKKDGSRASDFEEEKLFPLPLPPNPFELAEWKTATVQYNYHISVDRMNYSDPYEYIKQKVDVRLTGSAVEIYFCGTRVASHLRLYGRPNQYSMLEEHMPPEHTAYLQWNSKRFLRWASSIGENTAAVVRVFLTAHKVEQQGYKSCMALLKLSDHYSVVRLEDACRKALTFTPSHSLKSVQAILKSEQDLLQTEDVDPEPVPQKAHRFTRGAEYYRRGKK